MGTDTRPAPPSSRPSDGGLVSKAANELAIRHVRLGTTR
jgi:hypothetical protein